MKKQNPFSTYFTNPGQLSFISHNILPNQLAQRLVDENRTFQIVGPHGSGKTTLTIAIAKQLAQHSIACRWMTLRKSKRLSLPSARWESYVPKMHCNEVDRQILFVDGIESLSWMQRIVTVLNLRGSHVQTIVTSHRKLFGLPILATTNPTLETFRTLVTQLCPSDCEAWRKEVESAFTRTDGDVREAFFLLYDQWDASHRTKNEKLPQ